jgi:hypothetical protein
MKALDRVKQHLKPGQVYRRSDLVRWSKSVDRHLRQLVEDGTLRKVSPGVYSCPKKASFGRVPPEDSKVVRAFLKTGDFLLVSPNAYNSLGVGTTQLYNELVVYNRKRHGKFSLGGRVFSFRVKHYFPKKVTKEFLLVDLVNNINLLAEDQEYVLSRVKAVYTTTANNALRLATKKYAGVRAKRFFSEMVDVAA